MVLQNLEPAQKFAGDIPILQLDGVAIYVKQEGQIAVLGCTRDVLDVVRLASFGCKCAHRPGLFVARSFHLQIDPTHYWNLSY